MNVKDVNDGNTEPAKLVFLETYRTAVITPGSPVCGTTGTATRRQKTEDTKDKFINSGTNTTTMT